MIDTNQAAFMKELHVKFDKKMKEKEISDMEYWKAYLDKLVSMKPEGIASLQLQIKKVADMMENRIKILKKG
jgi:hypothetical protein